MSDSNSNSKALIERLRQETRFAADSLPARLVLGDRGDCLPDEVHLRALSEALHRETLVEMERLGVQIRRYKPTDKQFHITTSEPHP